MKVLLIHIPSRLQSIDIPYGILYIASSIIDEGHEVKIVDLCLDQMSDEKLVSIIKDYSPAVIGFSAITSGYKNLKRLAEIIKLNFPRMPLIAGGVIASVLRLLLTKTVVDIVVIKEGEIVIKNILRVISNNQSLDNIKGIAFRCNDGYKENPPEEQINNMDIIPFPPFHLIDLKKYCISVENYMDFCDWSGILDNSEINRIKEKNKYLIPIFSSRGCTHRCSFCYRHVKGIRQFSPEYVINHIKYIKERYSIHFFQFIDELTNVTKDWCHKFCDLLEFQNLDITYIISGARADNVDEHLLRRFKKTGCIKIGYGYESGSQKILDYIGKGTSRETNYNVALLMKKVGIYDAANMMIGFPPESPETIKETIGFLKNLNNIRPSINFILPFPGTRDWNYCLENGLIKDEEEFILGYDEACKFRVNLTKYPDKQVRNWHGDIMRALKLARSLKNKQYLKYLMYRVGFKLKSVFRPLKPEFYSLRKNIPA